MRRILLLLFLLCSTFIFCRLALSSDDSEPRAFVNGLWFTGKGFQPTTFYSVNGILTRQKPHGPAKEINLQGGFVVPAFGDAHNHSPSSKQDLERANHAYLDAGIFYVLNPGGDAESANAIRSQLGTPTTVDVIFAHALFTCSGGHPRPYLEYLIERGILPLKKEQLEGRSFYSVDSAADVQKVWPRYLLTKADFVKLVFVFSELYESADTSQKSLGLRLDTAKDIVRRAKIAGLRSGAHIESAHDFHDAVEAGVDLVMHLPAFPDPLDRQEAYRNKLNWEERYTISASDIKLAAERGVVVVTTAASGSAENFEKPNTLADMNENEKRFRRITIQNLLHLKEAGVPLAVGTDTMPGTGALNEMQFLKETDVFSNLELLKMWSETTPRSVFPQRKIGALEEGYEANFLVLDGNPIEDFSNMKRIRMRVKHSIAVDVN